MRAGELDHAEVVLEVAFPSGDDAPGVVEPREEAFDFPSSADTAQRPAILRPGAAPTIRGDHLDPVGAHERVIERVAVVAAVADPSGGGDRRGSGPREWPW